MVSWMRIVLEDAMDGKPWPSDPIGAGLRRMLTLLETREAHPFRTPELEQLADDLSECDNLADLSRLALKITHEVGFQNYTIFVLRQGTSGPFRSRVNTSYNPAWVSRYQEKAYQFVDPVVAEAMQRDGWFQFSELDASSQPVQEFWQDAEHHRIGRNGICFACTRPDGSRIGLSLATENTAAKTKALVSLNGFDLELLAQEIISNFCYFSLGEDGESETLSVEELRFLYTLATSASPEDAMKITGGFGSNKTLQSSIRRKLNVSSAFQAIAHATAKGLFDRLPYDAHEVASPFPELAGAQSTEDFKQDEC